MVAKKTVRLNCNLVKVGKVERATGCQRMGAVFKEGRYPTRGVRTLQTFRPLLKKGPASGQTRAKHA